MTKSTRWTIAATLYAVAIFIGSGIPGSEMPKVVDAFPDKLLHVCEYAVLGFVLVPTLRFRRKNRLSMLRAAIFALAIASLYAVTDEVHQLFVPGRETDILDWIADTSGATLGILVSSLITSWFLRTKSS